MATQCITKVMVTLCVTKVEIVFCMVCVFRVRACKSHRTYQVPRTQVPGTGMEVLRISQKFWEGVRTLYPYPYPHPHPGIVKRAYSYPGYCATGVQNLRKLGVRRGYECGTELTQVPVRVIPGVNTSRMVLLRTLQNTYLPFWIVPGTR